MKQRSQTLTLILALATASAALDAQDWPQFRGPRGDGHSSAGHLPLSWSSTKNVTWKIAIPGGGWSSPVLSKDRIYLTTATPIDGSADLSLRALCLATQDGRVLWNLEVFRELTGRAPRIHDKNSHASPTPVIDGDRVFVHFGHQGTACLNSKGGIVWTNTSLRYEPVHGNGGSPIRIGNSLIFNVDGGSDPAVVALDATSGKQQWKTPRQTVAKKMFSFGTPQPIEIDGRTQVISPGSGFVGGYDPATGKELWRVRYGEGYSVIPRPVFAFGLLFIGTGYDRPSVLAIRAAGASGDCTDSQIVWNTAKGAPNTPSMLVVNDELYFVSDAGIATCVDARTGTVFWTERLGGDFSASPLYGDGRIYFQNESGTGFVLKPGKTYELLARNELDERSLSSYAATDGNLFIRTAGHLWKIATP
ncbi:MAG: serine/threonine protein kinase [Pedosphaera sp.]|nr:serine/threonine protein kinase [Pedosphaera sp.]